MADGSHIEWTDATWNPVTGCSVVSPGCTNCYAMKLAGGRLAHHASRAGLTEPSKAGPVWNGAVRLNAEWLTQPLAWKRQRRIFVCAHGDLFHEAVPDAWIDQVFAVMALAPQHTFQVLTKRADRMRTYVERSARFNTWIEGAMALNLGEQLPGFHKGPLPNVWLGVSVEDQARANERIPELLATSAARRFISAEPLLGPIDLTKVSTMVFRGAERLNALDGALMDFLGWPAGSLSGPLHWVIVGGESGPGGRPMHPGWARKIRDDCGAAGVPFFFKQWGEFVPGAQEGMIRSGCAAWRDGSIGPGEAHRNGGYGTAMLKVGKRAAGALLDGREHREFPA